MVNILLSILKTKENCIFYQITNRQKSEIIAKVIQKTDVLFVNNIYYVYACKLLNYDKML